MIKPGRRRMLLGVGAAIVPHSAGSSAAETFSPIASVDAGFAPDLGAPLTKRWPTSGSETSADS